MVNLDKNDVEILDFIIDEILKNKTVDSALLRDNGYLIFDDDTDRELSDSAFARLLSVLKEYECAECEINDMFGGYAEQNGYTSKFKENGGFKKIYNDISADESHKNLLKIKDKNDAEYSKLRLNTFLIVFGFTVIGTFISLYTFIDNLSSSKDSKQLEERLKKIELELKELHTLPSIHKNLDSLNIPNSQKETKNIEDINNQQD